MPTILDDLSPVDLYMPRSSGSATYKPTRRQEMTRRCKGCKRLVDQSKMHQTRINWCKLCKSAYSRNSYLTHREHWLKYAAAQRKHKRAENREYAKAYRLLHPALTKAQRKQYDATHRKENAERTRQYRKDHPSHHAAYMQSHPEKLIHKNHNRYMCLVKANDGTLTQKTVLALFKQADKCPYCGIQLRDVAKKWQPGSKSLDHITPLSRGGAHSLTNVIVCCYTCNTKKGRRTLEEVGFVLRS